MNLRKSSSTVSATLSDFNQMTKIVMCVCVCVKIIAKIPNIKLNENPSSGNRSDPCGRTDRQTDAHDEANSRF